MLSPAFEAARDGNESALRELVARGWDPSEEDKHGSTALLWAAGGGHLPVCKFLVEECGLAVVPDAAAGQISAHTALLSKQALKQDAFGKSLRGDAKPLSKQALKRRRNALHWAARHGHLPVCK